ncbi:MAG: hypothetical protein WCA20_25215 [Candidatus Sulfotelmatobacter sp.]
MVELTFFAVKPEKQRADHGLFFEIAEASNPAIGSSHAFDFLHARALTALVGQIAPLGDHSVEGDSHMEPLAGYGTLGGDGRKGDIRSST